jgi:ketosteroid isomerase-like protein
LSLNVADNRQLSQPRSIGQQTTTCAGSAGALEWHVHARSATGSLYDNNYCGIFAIHDGKITAVREYLDTRYAVKVLFPNLDA